MSAFTDLLTTLFDRIKALIPGANTISDVDLASELDKLAEGKNLNWRESVVDFLNLVGVDSSRKHRDELADELGVDTALKSGSPEKNEALRKALFRKIAENGGNIPASLID